MLCMLLLGQTLLLFVVCLKQLFVEFCSKIASVRRSKKASVIVNLQIFSKLFGEGGLLLFYDRGRLFCGLLCGILRGPCGLCGPTQGPLNQGPQTLGPQTQGPQTQIAKKQP